MSGATKGAIVGLCNTVAVAVCIGIVSPGVASGELVVLVVMLGGIPGALTGALAGHIAGAMTHVNRAIVLVVMIALGCLTVALLGDMFDAQELTFVSCIPTAAACSILERWTRASAPVPAAVARVV